MSGPVFILELALLLAIQVDGQKTTCLKNLPPFLPCGCLDGCDVRGLCIIENSLCRGSRFGPKCEYDDLAHQGKIEMEPGQSVVSWVTDHDKETCNENPDLKYVSVSWEEVPFNFNWLWLHVKNTHKADDIEVEITTESGTKIPCFGMTTAFVDSGTIELHCTTDTRTKRILLKGKIIKNVCGLKISGGRQLAVNRSVEQATTYKSFSANFAVDGNTHADYAKGTCSHTIGTGWWKLNLDIPSFVYRILIITRKETHERILRYKLRARSNGREIYENVFYKPCLIYDITNTPTRLSADHVIITPIDTSSDIDKSLELCEVMVFGEPECPFAKFGMHCKRDCNCAALTQCYTTGVCPHGCAPGWLGIACSAECPHGIHGQDCKELCSENCMANLNGEADAICHHETGACLHGCRPGYMEANCGEECHPGTFGGDCNETCSWNCKPNPKPVVLDKVCNHETGACLHGCLPGFQEPNCDKGCSNDKFGDGCKKSCNPNCDANPNDNSVSSCHHITGACLHGCIPGYQPANLCYRECDEGTYGINCRQRCSSGCKPSPDHAEYATCNRTNGECIHGCQIGYEPPDCLECPNGKHGQDCKEQCNPHCYDNPNDVSVAICHHITGACLHGCVPGYEPVNLCNKVCPVGKYGQDCGESCNPHCYENPNDTSGAICHHISGACLHGCVPGYRPVNLCNKECPSGKYGEDCKETCNINCYLNPSGVADVSICHHITGACLQGCVPGYHPGYSHCNKDCPYGTYGRECAQECNAGCNVRTDGVTDTICDPKTGECLHGCSEGYKPPTCDDECPHGTYGTNCTLECSEHCNPSTDGVADSICDPKTGACPHGCPIGYQPPTCEDECSNGKYGQDCKETCNTNCYDKICHHINGDCTQGCMPGYQSDTACNKECPRGTYGRNCPQKCSANCNPNTDGFTDSICDPKNGACLHGCSIGYNPPTCDDECPRGSFGINCLRKCSSFCDASSKDPNKPICHHKTGVCVSGCLAGYQQPDCVDVCPPDTFGKYCRQSCSKNCAEIPENSILNSKCNHVTGACHGGCIAGYQPPNCEAACAPGTFGEDCMQKCSDSCIRNPKDSTDKTTCDFSSGVCVACPPGTFGKRDCMQTCSENCAEIPANSAEKSACNHTNGACFGGCIIGYEPPTCHAACPPGTFGMDCLQQCSKNCDDSPEDFTQISTCNHTNGACLGGCVSGYVPPNCEAACPPGTFGMDCLQQCSENCANFPEDSTQNSTCNHTNGACSFGCVRGYAPPNCEDVDHLAPSMQEDATFYLIPLIAFAGLVPLGLLLFLVFCGFGKRTGTNQNGEPEQENDDNEATPLSQNDNIKPDQDEGQLNPSDPSEKYNTSV